MIRTFRHKGLAKFFESGRKAGILPDHAGKLRRILTALDRATAPSDMGLPGFGLHPLTGRLDGFWAVTVSGNWRVVFRMEGRDAYDVNYLDYH
ncbi:MAG: type II toxin-antitoxin system RelE/ParE family toxin [Nitrospirota bacterium]